MNLEYPYYYFSNAFSFSYLLFDGLNSSLLNGLNATSQEARVVDASPRWMVTIQNMAASTRVLINDLMDVSHVPTSNDSSLNKHLFNNHVSPVTLVVISSGDE